MTAVAIASTGVTFMGRMASIDRGAPELNMQETVALIEKTVGRKISPVSVRRMISEGHPAVERMAEEGWHDQGHWRFPRAAVLWAAQRWPRVAGGALRISPATEKAILDWKAEGRSLQWMADTLQDRGVLSPSGLRTWDRSTIQRVLVRHGHRPGTGERPGSAAGVRSDGTDRGSDTSAEAASR